jgi:hypothetical protein
MSARWLVVVALALPLPAPAGAQTPDPDPQTLFAELVVKDTRTTKTVRDLLRTKAAFVAPQPLFADVTGDGRMDAVVEVRLPGAAGTVAVFVFSTDGTSDGRLRAIFRSQALYRASVQAAPGTLLVALPRYRKGDDVCCPAARTEQRYAWDAESLTLRRRKRPAP